MKAIVCTNYGGPEVLEIRDLPDVKRYNADELIVDIKSVSVNSGDSRIRGLDVSGVMKVVMRLILGWKRPRQTVLGTVFCRGGKSSRRSGSGV